MQFWQALAFTHPDDLLELAPVCEEAGFEGIMLADHLFAPEKYTSRYPYDESGEPPFDGETPFPESFATIAALSQVTTKLRFLTNVYILPLRHPIEIAKDLSTAAIFRSRSAEEINPSLRRASADCSISSSSASTSSWGMPHSR